MKTITLAAGLALAATAALAPSAAAATDVRTDLGVVHGTATATTRTFQGIPYAAPPTGSLRWQPPRSATPWDGVRDATRPGSACPQDQPFNPMSTKSDNEDCLYLNVTAPARGTRLPVLVWVHGGSLLFGSGDQYGAQRLASRDVVVVTLNYRLGAFGFLDHPSFGAESGNFGLQDQQAALWWVRRNAAAFGGDPGQVTLAGESAGGLSTCAQLTTPSSRGLFQRAIIESAPCRTGGSAALPTAPRSRAVAEKQGADIAKQLHCDVPDAASCLRAAKTSDILAVSDGGLGYGAVYGGRYLPEDPADALADGHFAHVPVLTGSNHDEESFMVAGMEILAGHPLTRADYLTQTDQLFGSRATAVRAEYPCADDACASPVLAALRTDALWALPAADTTRIFAAQVPTYTYEFADRDAPYFAGFPRPAVLGAGHTMELPSLFELPYAAPLSAAQQHLSDTMIGYWTRFARGGDPNGAGSPCWPPHAVLSLAPAAIGTTDFAGDHHLAFWSRA